MKRWTIGDIVWILLGLVLAYLALIAEPVRGQEKSVLTTPITTTITEYQVVGMQFSRSPSWYLTITYQDNLGRTYTDLHTTPPQNEQSADAQTLIIALNKANLTIKSLERRLMEHLVQEGKIPASTITGVPQ